jgi:hypothetical protein
MNGYYAADIYTCEICGLVLHQGYFDGTLDISRLTEDVFQEPEQS